MAAIDEPSPLAIPQVVLLLRSSTASLHQEFEAAGPALLSWHPAPGEWCVKEVLGHVIEADRRGFSGRIQLLVDHDGPDLLAWDQEEVARTRRDCDADADDLLHEFLSEREQGLRVLQSLRPADLRRSGLHPKVGVLSIGDVAHEWVHHDRNHLKQILSNVQAYVWPLMGAAQGFSGE